MNYWLVKQEPEDYSWPDFVREDGTAWTGVRNFQARNNLKAMRQGDLVLFYHSGKEKAVVGIASVRKKAYPDPTANQEEGDWWCADLEPIKPLHAPVSLTTIRGDRTLHKISLLKQSRLSVLPLTKAEFTRILKLAQTHLK